MVYLDERVVDYKFTRKAYRTSINRGSKPIAGFLKCQGCILIKLSSGPGDNATA
jgi:hypothetical protein